MTYTQISSKLVGFSLHAGQIWVNEYAWRSSANMVCCLFVQNRDSAVFRSYLYFYTGNHIQSIPDLYSIETTLTRLFLGFNKIATVSYINHMPMLQKLYLQQNKINHFPELSNVSASLQELRLDNHLITGLETIPNLSTLTTLHLEHNLLTNFPDLTNISANISWLHMGYNSITEVKFLPIMDKLYYINLGSNQLTAFPDLRNASSTLRTIELDNNQILSVPELLISQFNQLEYLNINTNPMHILPNFCLAGWTQRVSVYLLALPLDCEIREVITLKMALDAGRISLSSDHDSSWAPCVTPSELLGQTWSGIAIADLLKGKFI